MVMKQCLILASCASVASITAPCSLEKGCSWDKLPFYCNTPEMGVLSVDYLQVQAYSGSVSCGNLFREEDIGGGINTVPYVAYSKAKPGSFYTIVMVDPDADMDGSFPTATAPGGHAPVRHWIQGNIAGTDLQNADLSKSQVISPFHGPSPPAGSHRYGQFLFEQPHGKIAYTPFAANASITQFDYSSWISQHQLGTPVANNWHVTMHSN